MTVEKSAHIMDYAAVKHDYIFDAIDQWFASQTYQNIRLGDPVVITTGYSYVYHVWMDEEHPKIRKSDADVAEMREVMFWVGYFFAYWLCVDEITWEELKRKYDWKNIIENWEVYHTMSCPMAIADAKENTSYVNAAKIKAFGRI